MKFFLKEILEDEKVILELAKHPDLNKKGKRIAKYIVDTHEYPELQSGILPIYVLAYLADYALNTNIKRGIPHEITVRTLKDVNIWLSNYEEQFGEIGLAEFHWLIYHYTSRLFRIGRLQFQVMLSDKHIPTGEFVIETHIPQGEQLNIEECKLSFLMATEFFNQYFPEYKVNYFMCHSWLLNPRLADILDEKSNIVKFMRLWEQYETPGDNSEQAMERVFGFGFKKEDLVFAPERTSLQRALKNYLLSGEELDITSGYMKIF